MPLLEINKYYECRSYFFKVIKKINEAYLVAGKRLSIRDKITCIMLRPHTKYICRHQDDCQAYRSSGYDVACLWKSVLNKISDGELEEIPQVEGILETGLE